MKKGTPIRVMLVDDHTIVRRGIAALLDLSPEFILVGEAENGKEALTLCDVLTPDVVLMDLHMPVMDGLMATKEFAQQYPNVAVLILTSSFDAALAQQILHVGALGYLLKTVNNNELVDAICAANDRKLYMTSEVSHFLMGQAAQQQKRSPGSDLTERERDVLQAIVKGLNNDEIADVLVVTSATIKFHVSNILSKLNVRNRTEAVIKALDLHLV